MGSVVSIRMTRWIVLALLAANLFVGGMIVFFVQESRERYVDQAAVNAQNLSQVLEQQINASVRQLDISLRSTSDVIRNALVDNRTLSDMKLSGLLTQQHARLPDADRFYLTNERGQVVANSTFDSDHSLEVADQPFFTLLRDDVFASLVIGDPVPYRGEDRYVIPFARRIDNLDGAFAGALVVLVEVDRFARALTQVGVGEHGSVSLTGLKMKTIARYAQNQRFLHKTGVVKLEELHSLFQNEDLQTGKARQFTLSEGELVTVSLRKSPDWVFHVCVSLSAKDYLAPWRREVYFSIFAFLFFAFVSAAVARAGYLAWSAHLKAELELLRLSRFNQALIKAIPIPVFFKDREGRYLGCNPAFTELLGYQEAEIIGKTVGEHQPEPIAQFFSEQDAVIMESRHPQVFESSLCDRSGRNLHVIFARNVFLDERDTVAGIIGTLMDISERKVAEETIEQARIAAEKANQAKSQFLATMSHELRTPLNGILGMAQIILMTTQADEELRDYAQVILHSGETLLSLLNDILDLSKIEAGRFSLEVRDLDPAHVVHEIMALFSETATQKQLQLKATLPPDLSVHYRGDPIRLNQMLSNLVNNAIKFSEAGEIEIRVSEIQRTDQRARLRFEVLDSGIGIPADKIDLLFKPFSQTDGSTTRKFGGTGLGLSIVRNLAELMNGCVGVDSHYGKGSRFWFEVELDVADVTARVDAENDQ